MSILMKALEEGSDCNKGMRGSILADLMRNWNLYWSLILGWPQGPGGRAWAKGGRDLER